MHDSPQSRGLGKLGEDLVLAAAERKVLLSSQPWTQVKAEKNRFNQNPDSFDSLLAQLITHHPQWAELNKHTTSKTPLARSLSQRHRFLEDFKSQRESLTKIQPKTSNDAQAGERLKQVQKIENQINLLIARVQRNQLPQGVFLTLDLKKQALEKKIQILNQAPLPKGLKPAEQKEYRRLVEEQIQNLYREIERVSVDQQKQLEASEWISILASDHQTAAGGLRTLIRQELQALHQAMKSGSKGAKFRSAGLKKQEAFVQAALARGKPKPQQLNAERQRLLQNPQNSKAFESLKKLETQIGNPLFLQWVQARVEANNRSL
jgi:hypothetical protein